jgi:hypothetical protein
LDYSFFNGKAMLKDEKLKPEMAVIKLQNLHWILKRRKDGVVSLMRIGGSTILSPIHEAYKN